MDPIATERAEAELDSFIERRTKGRDQENEVDASWAAGERLDKAKRQRENREAWYAYHAHMSMLHAQLSATHEEKAQRLLTDGG